jgi:hypothetical protein
MAVSKTAVFGIKGEQTLKINAGTRRMFLRCHWIHERKSHAKSRLTPSGLLMFY